MTPATWIALGIIVLSLVLLAWASMALLRRLARLNAAAIGMQTRAEQAHGLQHQLEALEPRIVEMSTRLERITTRFGRR